MKKYLLLTVATILCFTPAVMPQRAGGASAEEYAVYSVVIAEIFSDRQEKSVVITDRTSSDSTTDGFSDRDQEYFKRMFPTLTEGVDKDYKARNKIPARLKDAFELKMRHVVLTKPEIDRIFKGNGSWDDFYKMYPTSVGIISLSRVGFSASMNQALVYIDHGCGGLCGTGHYVLLEKSADGWRVVNRRMVWIS